MPFSTAYSGFFLIHRSRTATLALYGDMMPMWAGSIFVVLTRLTKSRSATSHCRKFYFEPVAGSRRV